MRAGTLCAPVNPNTSVTSVDCASCALFSMEFWRFFGVLSGSSSHPTYMNGQGNGTKSSHESSQEME